MQTEHKMICAILIKKLFFFRIFLSSFTLFGALFDANVNETDEEKEERKRTDLVRNYFSFYFSFYSLPHSPISFVSCPPRFLFSRVSNEQKMQIYCTLFSSNV